MPDNGQKTYFQVVTEAVAAISAEGYVSPEQIAYWTEEIRKAAERSMRSQAQVDDAVRDALGAIFRRQVDQAGVLTRMPGVSAYTLQRMRPELHAELGRRVAASIDLIKLNREEAVRLTQKRFAGWATSVPVGGSETVDRVAEKTQIRKALASQPFEARRVIIDQSAKLVESINTTVATNGGAIGAVWQSHKFQAGYNGRPDHNALDGKFFLLKSSWAKDAGLVKPNGDGYTEDVTQPSILPFCKCHWVWRFSLRSIPPECLTEKGREALAEARRKVANAA